MWTLEVLQFKMLHLHCKKACHCELCSSVFLSTVSNMFQVCARPNLDSFLPLVHAFVKH